LDGLAIGCTVIAAGALAVLTYLSGHATFATYLELQRMPQIGELTIFAGRWLGRRLDFSGITRIRRNIYGRRGLAGAGRRDWHGCRYD